MKKKKEKTVEELELLLDYHEKKSKWAREQLESMKLMDELPKLKEQYEGKYFKYNRGYDVFLYCHEVIDADLGRFDVFTIDEVGDCSFGRNVEDYFSHVCETEISQDQYLTYLSAFHDILSGMLSEAKSK